MKNHSQHYPNDIHLIRVSQNFIGHKPGHHHPDHAKPENNANVQSVHSYIVDWQIPKYRETKEFMTLLNH